MEGGRPARGRHRIVTGGATIPPQDLCGGDSHALAPDGGAWGRLIP